MTPDLHAIEAANGALFAPGPAGELPAHFGDVRAEWTAVRQHCGLLDAGFRALWQVTGSDRTSFLHGMLSNDVAGLHPGEGTYALLLTGQGKVVSDLRVYVLSDEIWLDVPAARRDPVRAALERYIVADDVELVDAPSLRPLVAVEGRDAAGALLTVLSEPLALPAFAHRAAVFEGRPVRIVAANQSGESGYLVCGSPELAAPLWEQCRRAGAVPVGMDALDVLRLEAGIAWHGRDMDESTLVSEVGLEAGISYTKGCYLGQEVVERVAARGQVHRKLVGILVEGDVVPPAHAEVHHDGAAVGAITSAVWSPARRAVVALGYVRRTAWDVGTEVQVQFPDCAVSARVEALPFWTPPTVDCRPSTVS